ncbi:rhodanese-like domain-containing protein [Magnetospirillum sp. SS-4]|uniref:rhodanese-like domain-containing protein n=1 Tax=Magnetospirillum sp. SS-4 TaxID=2681465 RepID=UPI00137CE499|nr:rhodanese-like domain-containing protein [Magnetospirillum sp. SS-4]CAA7623515.1 Rhodanese domain protein [Magnetospirillum sp. SS-4]
MAAVRICLLALILAVAGFAAQAKDSLRHVDNAALAELIGRGVPVVDIRTPPEWGQTGIVKGAHRIMAFDERGKLAPDFIERLAKVAGPDDEVVLICRTGNRTRLLGTALSEQLGYSKVYNVEKGIVRWIGEGRPVEK